eukprot:TRINITY_DN7995_c0_g1_i1.p1 TRINITY_DN7995_c0_g1~~TRINITY_DN7995_c0_g1_i1.p1  ORF type:complete len:377 (-),score=76.45 TRINITY_DN7995_c0_g1_i1:16-1113(-)
MAEEETPAPTYASVLKWLHDHKLYRTADSLLEEYDAAAEVEQLTSVVPVVPALSELHWQLNHRAAIIAIQCLPTAPYLLASDSAKNLKVWDISSGKLLSEDRTNNPFDGTILSIDSNPVHEDLILVGSMDNQHALLRFTASSDAPLELLHRWHIHQKYVVCIKWSPDGLRFATGSHDSTVTIFALNEERTDAEQLAQVQFGNAVECLLWKDNQTLVVSVREDASLVYLDTDTKERTLVSMSENGDPHVNFNCLSLTTSRDGHILVSTDMSLAYLFRPLLPIPTRRFNVESDKLSQPRAVFDKFDLLYLTSQDRTIRVFDVSTGAEIASLSGHNNVIRDVSIHPTLDLLASCSYDKTIRVYSRSAK